MTSTAVRRIPLWVKTAYSVFVAILVPFYLHQYGWTNFLYFCDVALFLTLAAVWTERPIWASMPAVGILAPQSLWMLDFLAELVGLRLTGMTHYMFEDRIMLFARLLSLFHFWLPILLVWLVARLGYDRRALAAWTVAAWLLILISYLFLPPPPAPADDPNLPVNVNYVYGFGNTPQTMLPQPVYLVLLMLIMPTCLFFPVHWVLGKLWGAKGDATRRNIAPQSA